MISIISILILIITTVSLSQLLSPLAKTLTFITKEQRMLPSDNIIWFQASESYIQTYHFISVRLSSVICEMQSFLSPAGNLSHHLIVCSAVIWNVNLWAESCHHVTCRQHEPTSSHFPLRVDRGIRRSVAVLHLLKIFRCLSLRLRSHADRFMLPADSSYQVWSLTVSEHTEDDRCRTLTMSWIRLWWNLQSF